MAKKGESLNVSMLSLMLYNLIPIPIPLLLYTLTSPMNVLRIVGRYSYDFTPFANITSGLVYAFPPFLPVLVNIYCSDAYAYCSYAAG